MDFLECRDALLFKYESQLRKASTPTRHWNWNHFATKSRSKHYPGTTMVYQYPKSVQVDGWTFTQPNSHWVHFPWKMSQHEGGNMWCCQVSQELVLAAKRIGTMRVVIACELLGLRPGLPFSLHKQVTCSSIQSLLEFWTWINARDGNISQKHMFFVSQSLLNDNPWSEKWSLSVSGSFQG